MRPRLLGAAVVLCTMAAVSPDVRAQTPVAPLQLLDVPYLPQSVALCGGAAAAMVMRYWGATGVYAETFSNLVAPGAGGIRGADLVRALQTRGWDTRSFRGDPAFVRTHLAAGRPVIALIEDRPGQFHYVVVVGWHQGRVIAHDPARAPFRVFDEEAFVAVWQVAGFWTLLALPAASDGTTPEPAAAPVPVLPAATTALTPPCSAMVDEGVRLAGAGELAEARRLFALAADACPQSAAPWREMAGVDALQGNWGAAAGHARRALAHDESDQHARRILATGLYLEGDTDGALEAWNALGEPIVDLVDITGLDRTRYAVAMAALGLQPQTLLTAHNLRTARQRLAQLPSAQMARVAYRPGKDGRAQVEAVVLERPLVPTSPLALAATAVSLVTDRELAVAVSSPTGGGEVFRASWRWWERRPRAAVEFAAPAPFGGVWGVGTFAESQTYRLAEPPASPAVDVSERRRGVELSLIRWARAGLRLDAAAGFDRWSAATRTASVRGGVHKRFAGDRAFLEGDGGMWFGGLRTWTASGHTEWRSSSQNEGQVVIARAGVALAGADAPLALWSGAGTGQGRDILLRAHPLLDDGVLTGRVFGRIVTHAGGEWRRWTQLERVPVRTGPALFVDSARASRGGTRADERWHTDIGVGWRVALPGAGIVRIDIAHGLRDGGTHLSVGWTR